MPDLLAFCRGIQRNTICSKKLSSWKVYLGRWHKELLGQFELSCSMTSALAKRRFAKLA